MPMRRLVVSFAAVILLLAANAHAFLEDLCLPRNPVQGQTQKLSWCVNPTCLNPPAPSRSCPQQLADFATIKPGRSMIHADATYFIAQALGYRADVAYWIAAYNEVADYAQYAPIDQCGVQATATNSGAPYITAAFNGFRRTNNQTDGPLDHYILSFSPSGQGNDVHGAGGVQAIYPLYYPRPGYPEKIDTTYQTTLANLRQWGMLRSREPGLLCVVGLTDATGTKCLEGGNVTGTVPTIMNPNAGSPIAITAPLGKKVLDLDTNTTPPTTTYYEELGPWLNDKARTTGTLWLSPVPIPVPVQLARVGLYLHSMQDSASHATYCGDEAPSPPNGGSAGTYMYMNGNDVNLAFGNSCAVSPHIAGHVEETGTGDASLPLRVYTALNITVDELIVFGNEVAKHHEGWIVNPELLPPNVTGGRNAQGASADDLKNTLVGTIVSGKAYSRAEVYKSGAVTLPLQQTNTVDRLTNMNKALAQYGEMVRVRSSNPSKFVTFEHMPGNSADPNDKRVCFK